MNPISIPGFGTLDLRYLVVDYNGTLAEDGILIPGVAQRIVELSKILTVHAITADTFGTVHRGLSGMPCSVHLLSRDEQIKQKAAFIQELCPENVACIGNGRNDALMLKNAALGIAVMQREGGAWEAMRVADIVCTNIITALDLLLFPRRLTATLRS